MPDRALKVVLSLCAAAFAAPASQAFPLVDGIGPFASARAMEAKVDECLETEGVGYLTDGETICYNSAIFPEQFLTLNTLDEGTSIIITSPGGNVATARLMSTILDRKDIPAVIAGPCYSACAMMTLPGLDEVYIHESAEIAVHGIIFAEFNDWYRWRHDEEPSGIDRFQATMGYNFAFMEFVAARDHVEEHLEDQGVEVGYIGDISSAMLDDAAGHRCKTRFKDYWGIIPPAHVTTYLGDRLLNTPDNFDRFDGDRDSWFAESIVTLTGQTFIFADDYEDATCAE